MSGYGAKEARIDRQRRPNVNTCGACGDECVGILCTECVRIETENRQQLWGEPEDEMERRTR